MAKSKTRAGSRTMDQFPNFYKAYFATSAADTITYSTWLTGYSIKDGIGFVIHSIMYKLFGVDVTKMDADGNEIYSGLVTNNTLTTPDLQQGVSDSILDDFQLSHREMSAVGFANQTHQYLHDFTNEPGGGRIIAPKPLYLALSSSGLGATIHISIKIVYTMINLNEAIYRELYESMNPNA